MTTPWTPEHLTQLSASFETRAPQDLLRWAFETFGPDVALGTGFGPSGVVLVHMVAALRPETTVFYLDTGLLFPETHALREALAERLGLAFTRVSTSRSLADQARTHGPALWTREPDRCCALRKVEPLRQFLASRQAWITGIRRDQAPSRARTSLVEWDPVNELVKLNPLAAWASRDVWAYITEHRLPYNALHDYDFPSVGCLPCTRPVEPGAGERSGRWPGHTKTECGIHLQPDKSLI